MGTPCTNIDQFRRDVIGACSASYRSAHCQAAIVEATGTYGTACFHGSVFDGEALIACDSSGGLIGKYCDRNFYTNCNTGPTHEQRALHPRPMATCDTGAACDNATMLYRDVFTKWYHSRTNDAVYREMLTGEMVDVRAVEKQFEAGVRATSTEWNQKVQVANLHLSGKKKRELILGIIPGNSATQVESRESRTRLCNGTNKGPVWTTHYSDADRAHYWYNSETEESHRVHPDTGVMPNGMTVRTATRVNLCTSARRVLGGTTAEVMRQLCKFASGGRDAPLPTDTAYDTFAVPTGYRFLDYYERNTDVQEEAWPHLRSAALVCVAMQRGTVADLVRHLRSVDELDAYFAAGNAGEMVPLLICIGNGNAVPDDATVGGMEYTITRLRESIARETKQPLVELAELLIHECTGE